jgi:hypothetical protein
LPSNSSAAIHIIRAIFVMKKPPTMSRCAGQRTNGIQKLCCAGGAGMN